MRLGRYRLAERLGSGGMATVYRAEVEGPEGFSRALVLKRVRPELSADPRFTRMLVDEARLSALLRHPHIVQVFELGHEAGEYFLAMEFVDGLDLAVVLRRCAAVERPLPPGVACFLVGQVASALAYAHDLRDERGRPLQIVHRDVSPANIMITRSGTAKLLDFGIAKAAAAVQDEHTRTGILKGKVGYLSPEQVQSRAVDRRCDLFALGVVLHECLTARRLFRGGDDLETLNQIREAKVAPPSRACPGLSPDIDAIVLRLLARDPDARYQHCDELAAALTPVVHRLGGDERAVRSFLDRLDADAPEQPEPGSSAPAIGETTAPRTAGAEPTPARSSRGARRIAIAFALASLAAAGAVGTLRLLPRRAAAPAVVAPAIRAAPPVAVEPPAPPVSAPAPAGTVRLRVDVGRRAAVTVDGKLVGRAPLDVELPRAPGRRTVEVRVGSRSLVRSFAADRDARIVLHAGSRRPRRPGETPGQEDADLRDPFAR